MVSTLHEALVLLFHNRPTLAPELLASALGVDVPAYTSARLESAELTQIAPTEYRADLVVVLADETPILSIIVEVQLAADERKRWSWPVYVAALRARWRCPTVLLVVTPDEDVAVWARQPIGLGSPGHALTPFVLGPASVPVVVDPREASRDPELAVLSAISHGTKPADVALPIAVAALGAVLGLDGERAKIYADLILSRIGGAAKLALEALMQSGKYVYQSDFAKKYIALGEADGQAKGMAEGEAKGEALGRARAVLGVLAARGVPVTATARDRVLACRDLALLDRWIALAVTAGSVDQLVDENAQ